MVSSVPHLSDVQTLVSPNNLARIKIGYSHFSFNESDYRYLSLDNLKLNFVREKLAYKLSLSFDCGRIDMVVTSINYFGVMYTVVDQVAAHLTYNMPNNEGGHNQLFTCQCHNPLFPQSKEYGHYNCDEAGYVYCASKSKVASINFKYFELEVDRDPGTPRDEWQSDPGKLISGHVRIVLYLAAS